MLRALLILFSSLLILNVVKLFFYSDLKEISGINSGLNDIAWISYCLCLFLEQIVGEQYFPSLSFSVRLYLELSFGFIECLRKRLFPLIFGIALSVNAFLLLIYRGTELITG